MYMYIASYPCKYWHFAPVPLTSLSSHLKGNKLQDSLYNPETKVTH